MHGPERLLSDLRALGLEAELVKASDGREYVVIPAYCVELGRFAGREIGLGLVAQPDYPRTTASAIHVRSDPPLFETTDSLQDVRNIQPSVLGAQWRYWSKNFGGLKEDRTTERLLAQIAEVFRNA